MNDSKVTSKFVGILLDKNLFPDLFTQLRNYLIQNNLLDSIILHDVNSIHLTLYYLDAYLSDEENERLQLLVDKLRKDFKSLELHITSFNYFSDQGEDRTAYFEANNTEKLTKTNKILRLSFPNKVLDNTYHFVAHVTLFRIEDYSLFKVHRENLEKILSIFIEKIKDKNIFKSINVFQVDSTKEPENYCIIK